jgi:hypothetical protein
LLLKLGARTAELFCSWQNIPLHTSVNRSPINFTRHMKKESNSDSL